MENFRQVAADVYAPYIDQLLCVEEMKKIRHVATDTLYPVQRVNHQQKKCCERDPNPLPLDYELHAITRPNCENKSNLSSEIFSDPLEKLSKNSIKIEEMKDGDKLPFDGGYSMADFIRSRATAYKQYKKNKEVTDETTASYL